MRGAEQVRQVDLLGLVLEDRGLDGAVQELVGVAAEELVERVLAGDVDRQPAAAAPGAAPHLAQRGDRPGERDDDRGVERADVDAELERVGRHDRPQLAVRQPLLELAALLGRVAGAVGGDRAVELRRLVGEAVGDELRHQLDRLARLDEADAARAAGDEVEQHVGGLAERAAALLQRLVDHRRVPHRDVAARRAASRRGRRARTSSRPVSRSASSTGLAIVARREQDPRRRAVRRGDPPQPAQHVGHVRAEHAAVDVRLVDDDDREVREEVRPQRVVGQDPDVEHVGVGQHEVRLAADRGALLARRVAVVDRRADGLAEPERVDRARLVLGQRLGGVEVQRARLGVACTARRASAG